MDKKKVINNSFFDLLWFFLSFIICFFRSFKIIFLNNFKKTNKFFDLLDFIFRKWSKYFWEKPSIYKLSSFVSDIINFIFKK